MPERGQILTDIQRCEIGEFILQHLSEGKIATHCRKEAAQRWNTSVRTISRLSNLHKRHVELGLCIDWSSKVKGKQGRKKVEINKELAMAVSLPLRTTQRGFAAAIGVSTSAMHRWIKEGQIQSHSNAIKPQISATNQLHRLYYSLSHLKDDTSSGITSFMDMNHIIHIDEKWFYITRVAEKYYLLPDEEEPHCTVQNKRYISKIMFLCAVCRPIINNVGEVFFEEKIGIWPFTHEEAAKKTSKNRPASTLEIKPILSIGRDVTKDFMLTKFVPAIKRKWPLLVSTNITIRQDNARPHICDDDAEFRLAASSDGFNIRLGFQPLRSPDLNVLDLDFFNSIQSLQHKSKSRTLDQLISATESAFENLEASKLNKFFLTLQCVMVEIIKCKGSNVYKLPHIKKDALLLQGMLPSDIEVDMEVVREGLRHLIEANNARGLEYIIQQVMG